jgi:uncharacterized membrane protein YqjE
VLFALYDMIHVTLPIFHVVVSIDKLNSYSNVNVILVLPADVYCLWPVVQVRQGNPNQNSHP